MTETLKFLQPRIDGEPPPEHAHIRPEREWLEDLTLQLLAVVPNRKGVFDFDSDITVEATDQGADRFEVKVFYKLEGRFQSTPTFKIEAVQAGIFKVTDPDITLVEHHCFTECARVLFCSLIGALEPLMQHALQNLNMLPPDFTVLYNRRLIAEGGRSLIKKA